MESEQGGNSPLHGGKGYPALLVASAPHFTATVFYGGRTQVSGTYWHDARCLDQTPPFLQEVIREAESCGQLASVYRPVGAGG